MRRPSVVFSPAGFFNKSLSVEEGEETNTSADDENAQTGLTHFEVNSTPLPKARWTFTLIFCNFSIIIGSTFMFGYNAIVINETSLIIKQFINDSFTHHYGSEIDDGLLNTLWSWTVSLFLAGGMIGGLLGPLQSDRIGRKPAMLLNSVIGAIAGVLMLISPYLNMFELLMAGRLVAGFQCGSASAIVPAYLTELAPISLRGQAGIVNQISVVVGGIIAAILGLPAIVSSSPNAWPLIMFIPTVFFPVFEFVLMLFCVESPYWAIRKDETQCFEILFFLRKNYGMAFAELDNINRDRVEFDSRLEITAWQSFVGCLGWPLVISVVMQLAQQITGISAAAYYSSDLLLTVLQAPIPQYASLGVPVSVFASTIVSIFLIEQIGRRPLMIAGLFGMWLACILITVFLTLVPVSTAYSYLAIVSIFMFVATFAIGPGSIPWFIAPELSLPEYRTPTIAICTLVNWAGNFAVGLGFPILSDALGSYSFAPFFGLISVILIFTFLFLPETKSLPPEENIRLLSRGKIQLNFHSCLADAENNQRLHNVVF